MRLRAREASAQVDYRSGDVLLTLRVARESRAAVDAVVNMRGELAVEVKQQRKARTLHANAYLWVVCDKVAQAVGSTKELVYREIVRRCGVFDVVAAQAEKAEGIIRGWECRGLGWVAETLDGCRLDGCVWIALYYGSSVYDTVEFSRLLNEVLLEAKELGIDTATPDEVALMMARWADEKQTHEGACNPVQGEAGGV